MDKNRKCRESMRKESMSTNKCMKKKKKRAKSSNKKMPN